MQVINDRLAALTCAAAILWFVTILASGAQVPARSATVFWPAAQDPPPPPPGTEKVVSFDRHGSKLAACAQTGGPPIKRGVRSLPATEVWITDGTAVWKTAVAPATCDPAWSPAGDRLAVTALDGVWVLSGNQQRAGQRVVEASDSERPANESDYTAFAKPKWSPDGTRLAYLATNGGTSWVEAVEVASGRRVFKSDPEMYTFTWGADSRSLEMGGKTVRVP